MPVPGSFPARKKCMIQASFPILFSFSCASRGRLRFPASFFLYLHNNLHLLGHLRLLLCLALCLLPPPLLSCRKKDFFGRKTVPIHPVIIIRDSALIPFIQGHFRHSFLTLSFRLHQHRFDAALFFLFPSMWSIVLLVAGSSFSQNALATNRLTRKCFTCPF